jgi:hypothetical protein
MVVDPLAMLEQRQLLILGRGKREMETPVWKWKTIDGKQIVCQPHDIKRNVHRREGLEEREK